MRYLRLALLPLVFAACTEQATVAPIDDGPAFNWMNNPDGGGLRVYRSADHYAACWSDATNGMRACHATVPLGQGSEPDCGLQADAEPGAWQEVLAREDVYEDWDRVLTHFQGDVYITVRDQNSPGTCFDSELVAEGWGAITHLDNDIYGTVEPNTNTWGASAHGALMTPGGEKVQYSGHFRAMWRYYPSYVYRPLSYEVNVR